METVYIETTIPSYLTAHRSQKEPMASHQRMTHEWWEQERARFRLYSSIAVRAEISKGYCTYHRHHMPVICTPELLTKPEP